MSACETASLRGGAGSVCCTQQRRRNAGESYVMKDRLWLCDLVPAPHACNAAAQNLANDRGYPQLARLGRFG
jgi:hypothetical protein